MKKIIGSIALLMTVTALSLPSIPVFADSYVSPESTKEASLDSQELIQLVDEMKNSGLLAESKSGALQVTEQYANEVQNNLGDAYTVTVEDNTLKISENGLLARSFFGGGETKLVFHDTGIDFYINGMLCSLLKGGMDISSFIASLIPIPVLNTVIAKIITLSKNIILGKDKGNGVILSIKMFRGTYIPYFVTVKAQN